jgi:hypothetical protein
LSVPHWRATARFPGCSTILDEGHGFSRATPTSIEEGFTGCGKTEFFEGDGLQAVRKRLKTGPALAAEGTAFAPYSTFFRSLFLAVRYGYNLPMSIPPRSDGTGTYFVTTATFNRRRLFQVAANAELFLI